jgi:hypothetical protein
VKESLTSPPLRATSFAHLNIHDLKANKLHLVKSQNVENPHHAFLSTTNEMQRYTVFFIVVSALHVSSGFSAHHQELKNCIRSIGTGPTATNF